MTCQAYAATSAIPPRVATFTPRSPGRRNHVRVRTPEERRPYAERLAAALDLPRSFG
ncbi:hypothetical protein [Nocardioides hwasunensis]|uniref:Uncharacterized protein n=1 Tax=Nocardioides hwasunensis TaxID=397258 RepID=A0ABR8MAC8_9ACTN|nr:hypothetical protein [Nocardioides hwasunensis]MBD3913121.1 hypothetical protein [Nocardioides hwasunensis]